MSNNNTTEVFNHLADNDLADNDLAQDFTAWKTNTLKELSECGHDREAIAKLSQTATAVSDGLLNDMTDEQFKELSMTLDQVERKAQEARAADRKRQLATAVGNIQLACQSHAPLANSGAGELHSLPLPSENVINPLHAPALVSNAAMRDPVENMYRLVGAYSLGERVYATERERMGGYADQFISQAGYATASYSGGTPDQILIPVRYMEDLLTHLTGAYPLYEEVSRRVQNDLSENLTVDMGENITDVVSFTAVASNTNSMPASPAQASPEAVSSVSVAPRMCSLKELQYSVYATNPTPEAIGRYVMKTYTDGIMKFIATQIVTGQLAAISSSQRGIHGLQNSVTAATAVAGYSGRITAVSTTDIAEQEVINLLFSALPRAYASGGMVVTSRTGQLALHDIKYADGRKMYETVLQSSSVLGMKILVDDAVADVGNSSIPIYFLNPKNFQLVHSTPVISRVPDTVQSLQSGTKRIAGHFLVGGRLLRDTQVAAIKMAAA